MSLRSIYLQTVSTNGNQAMKSFAYFVSVTTLIISGCSTPTIQEHASIEQGMLTGVVTADQAVTVFKGVPFAAPPVDEMRWMPPGKAESWEGMRQADTFGASCMQNLARSREPWTKEFMVQNDASEDCLFLNVWTPAKTAAERLPVLVYIHGGGFNEGSGEVLMYDGEQLARKGIVVVTINYRVGVLGFLAHPELAEASAEGAAGNYGLLDQVAALEWVQQNIAAFGGDPNTVAIVGQSAGAASVYYLMASPLAKGLFHRAIMQSGPGALASIGARGSLAGSQAGAEQNGLQFAAKKGAASIADLRALPVDVLTEAIPNERPMGFRPVVDGWFLPEDPSATIARGEHNDVPLMSGLTADEGSAFFAYGKLTAEAFVAQSKQRYGDKADAFLALYPANTDDESAASQIASAREVGLVSLAALLADYAMTSESDTYAYYFTRAIPWPEQPQFGAFHTGEVPYVFNNLALLDRPWEPEDRVLADQMSSYWANFTKQGDPNSTGLPDWPVFQTMEDPFMHLGVETGPMPLPEKNKVAFFLAGE